MTTEALLFQTNRAKQVVYKQQKVLVKALSFFFGVVCGEGICTANFEGGMNRDFGRWKKPQGILEV